MRGVKGNQYQGRGNGFSNGDSVVGDVHGKLRSGQRFSGLGENEMRVGIGFYVEVHNQGGARVASGIERIHVVHVVHAAHLLLDGGGNRLLQALRVGADVGGQDLNLWRSDVWELGDRQAQDGDGTNQHYDDGDHDGDDGTIDEEL